MKIILKIIFLIFNNTNRSFIKQRFSQKIYILVEILLQIKKI